MTRGTGMVQRKIKLLDGPRNPHGVESLQNVL